MIMRLPPKLCVALLTISMVGCSGRTAPRPAELERIEYGQGTLRVEFDGPVRLAWIVVRDDHGQVVQEMPVRGERATFEVPFVGDDGAAYDVRLDAGDRVFEARLELPTDVAPLAAAVEAPFGQQSFDFAEGGAGEVLIAAGGSITIAARVECLLQQASEFELALDIPADVHVSEIDGRFTTTTAMAEAEGTRLALRDRLAVSDDFVQATATVRLARGAEQATIDGRFRAWRAEADDEGDILDLPLRLVLRSIGPAELAALIEVEAIVFPADFRGQQQPERPAETVVLADPVWATLRRLLIPAGRLIDVHAPYGDQAVWLTSRSSAPVNLVVESSVADSATGEALLDFAPPAWLAPRESPTAEHVLRLEAGETGAARFPLFVRPSVQPGRYERQYRVYMLGAGEPLLELASPLWVIRGDAVVSGVVVASLVGSVIPWLVMAIAGRRIVRRIGVVGLTTIALVAGLHFSVSYVARLGGDVLAGVLGPFAIFVAGLGNEAIPSLLLAAVVTLVPRPGVWTLSSLTVFLLNAIFTGQIGLADVLFVTVSIALGETLLALLGVTVGPQLGLVGGRFGWSFALRVAVAIGVANAATLYAQFCLVQVLYRLFFASWYVLAVSIVTGLLYGALGAVVGAMIGSRLRRTAR